MPKAFPQEIFATWEDCGGEPLLSTDEELESAVRGSEVNEIGVVLVAKYQLIDVKRYTEIVQEVV